MDFVDFLSQMYGKGRETAHKLRFAGYTTSERFSCATPQELSAVTGLALSCSQRMVSAANEMLQQDGREWRSRLVDIEGIGDRRAKKLQEAGLSTVKAVAGAEKEKLAKMLNVPKSTAGRIIKSAQRVSGRAPGAKTPAQETEIASAKVLSGASTGKGKPKAPPQSVKSYWRFG